MRFVKYNIRYDYIHDLIKHVKLSCDWLYILPDIMILCDWLNTYPTCKALLWWVIIYITYPTCKIPCDWFHTGKALVWLVIYIPYPTCKALMGLVVYVTRLIQRTCDWFYITRHVKLLCDKYMHTRHVKLLWDWWKAWRCAMSSVLWKKTLLQSGHSCFSCK